MADDKNLVDAYASIYNKKEESSEKLNLKLELMLQLKLIYAKLS